MEISLFELKNGKKAEIKRLEGGIEFRKKLSSLNIRIGKKIKKITSQPFRGPVVIEIDNTKATIGMGIAKRIFLEVEE